MERRIDTENDDFQVLRALLTNRRKRHKAGRFLVQGVRPISQAVAGGWAIEAFLVNREGRRSGWADDLLASTPHQTTYVVAPDLMAELGGKDEAVELVAVAEIPDRKLIDIPVDDSTVVVVLDRPSNPGNLGTVVRSADALGAAAVVIAGHAADPYDPQCVRASTGSLFAVPVVPAASIEEVAGWAKACDPPLSLVAAEEAGAPITKVRLEPPVALLFGNEGSGLSRGALERCERTVAIEMTGTASSLNLASSVAIVLHEIRRSESAGDLTA